MIPDEECYKILQIAAKLTREAGVKIENPRNDVDDLEALADTLQFVVQTLKSVIVITKGV